MPDDDLPAVKTIPPNQHPADEAFDEVMDKYEGGRITVYTLSEAVEEMRRRWKRSTMESNDT